MPLPDCFADPNTQALPLSLVDPADLAETLPRLPPGQRGWIEAHGFKGEPGSALLLPDAEGRPAAAVAGIGDALDPASYGHLPASLPPATYRLADDRPHRIDPARLLLGWGLGAYRFDRYLKTSRPTARLAIDGSTHPEALALLAASIQVRDLVNTPTEHLGPAELEAVVRELGERHRAELCVIRGDELLTRGFPAIHAVGRASHRAPRLIELRHGDPALPGLVLVGKGVCFDTGGLDLKPAEGMRWMKKDMGGAAHAIALASLVLERGLPVRLTLLIPAVENAVGPESFRPGEVIATRSGVSVEIDNTDAEGRLILGDALVYAAESRPDLVMDFATLTGAARIALGPDLPALFCRDDALAADYLAAGSKERDPLWRMPLWRPYLGYLKSAIADLANAGPSKMAGCITAALYLDRFVPQGQSWTHVDVYSWNDLDRPGRPAGGEAQGLRAAWALLRQRYPA